MESQRIWAVMLVFSLASCADPERLHIGGNRGGIAESVTFADAALDEAQYRAACIQLQGPPFSASGDIKLYLRFARVSFDRKNYGQAIVFADEVIKRDPGNKDAMSIMAVSALRVSTSALDSLRSGLAPKQGKVAQAQVLADLLRAALGEKNLVPEMRKDHAR
jgi:hypothetical protein